MSETVMDLFLKELGKQKENEPFLPIGDTSVDRLPVILAIDHSQSLQASGDIEQVNAFLKKFAAALQSPVNNPWHKIRQHLDLCIVGYNQKATVLMGWTAGADITVETMPIISASGWTAMGAGLELCASEMALRLVDYQRRALLCFQGYIFNVTDGNPTDMAPGGKAELTERWQRVKQMMDGFETKSSTGSAYAQTFHMASRQANREQLGLLAYKEGRVIDLEEANFERLFEFIHISLRMAIDEDR